MPNRRVHYQKRRDDGFRSGLEARVGGLLRKMKVKYEYETITVPFTQPAKSRRYTPDFLLPNGIVIEVKGRFTTADRQKHLYVRDSWPTLDIRFVFQNPNSRISKRSKTTYARWCESKGFLYTRAEIPFNWISEPPNEESLSALAEIRNHKRNR